MYKIEEYLLRLAYAEGISAQGKWRVFQHLLQSSQEETEELFDSEKIIKLAKITAYRELFRKSWLNTEENWESISKDKRYITCLDARYPRQLHHLAYPPTVLFYKGNLELLEANMLSIVGAREPSFLGKKTVFYLLRPVIEAGYVIVSGCARGIDTFGHQAALETGGKTIAVIATGIDQIYPKENKKIQEIIGKEHLLLSEYPPNAGALRHRFPMRNRIIAALSKGTCVIEARKRSGSLITAQQALDLGREVFAVPGNILAEHSEGCHQLIQDGAKCTISGQDILAELP
ncbi:MULTISPECIES: DNA-processing protein DprA [unclassified Enterococcus]|jgi:DNA processing protein|uniref:DNA-processing protein DprA n=1 Tax=unclassified Enterococcus TaxID=2608891 RepID=UPI003D2C13C5